MHLSTNPDPSRNRQTSKGLRSGASADLQAHSQYEFEFARLVYAGTGGGDWPRWRADWPEAETHFLAGLKRLTLIDVRTEGRLVEFDENLFDFPWIYAVEVGALTLTTKEARILREYLNRGGFLMVDDFHGSWQWENFEAVMRQVFPERKILDLGSESELFHTLYDVSERTQIPGIRALMNNQTWEYDGRIPHWRGILDDEGRVMVAINFNMDLGDAWEHADEAGYPERFTGMAYRLGVNFVIYSMTH